MSDTPYASVAVGLMIGLSGVRWWDAVTTGGEGTSSWSPGPPMLSIPGLWWLMTSDTSWHTGWWGPGTCELCCDKPGLLMDDFNIFINTWTFNILQSMSFLRRFSCKLVQVTIVSMININPISQNAFQRPRNLLDACQLLIDVYWLATLSAGRSTCTAGSAGHSALQPPLTLT